MMEENGNTFKSVSVKKGSNSSFSRMVFLPFLSGIVGASLVIGTCFGVPKIWGRKIKGCRDFQFFGR